MYEIYSDGSLIWSPKASEVVKEVHSATLETELNAFGALTFTMPPGHPMYGQIEPLKSVITVEKDGVQIWRGRLTETKRDFYNQLECTCEGELAFLVDYIQPPFEYKGGLVGYFTKILAEYNRNVDACKRFGVGNVTVTDPNDYIYRYKDTYNTTWDVLNEQLIDTHGGYLVPRTDNGAHYLDYLAELPETSQEVRYGRNLIDLTETVDSSEVFTVLIPLGALPEGESDEGKRLTIADVNEGKIYIENAEAIAKYGRIWAVKTWEDVTTAKALLTKGKSALLTGAASSSTIEANAVDLSLTGDESESLECGKMVHVISKPHGIDMWLPISKVRGLDLQEAGKESYTMGKTLATMTGASLKVESTSTKSAPKEETQQESVVNAYDDFWGEE